MKVAHLITNLGSGGAESMLARLAIRNRTSGGPPEIVISLMDDGVYGEALRASGVPVHCLRMGLGRPSVAVIWQLFRVLRAERPDLLMTWLYHSDLIGTVVARLAGIRRIVWNLRCSEAYSDSSRFRARLKLGVLARLSRIPSAIGANSEAGRRVHERLGYKPRQWLHLPNGFDLEMWRPDERDRADVRKELGFTAADIAIVMVARVDPLKDHATFLAAAERLHPRYPNLRFVLVGRGTLSIELSAGFGERCVLLGERADLPRLLRGFDIAVLSSRSEGFPNVIAEAMASGLACVASDVGDAAMMLADVGSVVQPADSHSLSVAMEKLVLLSELQRRQLGERARKRIESHWSLDAAVRAYRGALQGILASHA